MVIISPNVEFVLGKIEKIPNWPASPLETSYLLNATAVIPNIIIIIMRTYLFTV